MCVRVCLGLRLWWSPYPTCERPGAEWAGRMAITTGHRLLGVVETMSYLDCESCGERTHPLRPRRRRSGGDGPWYRSGRPHSVAPCRL